MSSVHKGAKKGGIKSKLLMETERPEVSIEAKLRRDGEAGRGIEGGLHRQRGGGGGGGG